MQCAAVLGVLMATLIVLTAGQGLWTLPGIASTPVQILMFKTQVPGALNGIQPAFATIGGIVNFRKGAEKLLFYCRISPIKLPARKILFGQQLSCLS